MLRVQPHLAAKARLGEMQRQMTTRWAKWLDEIATSSDDNR
jgi:hypothetical protein